MEAVKDIPIELLGRECGLRFGPWAYTLAAQSAGKPFEDLVSDTRKTTMACYDSVVHIFYGAAVNWCQLHNVEPFFNHAQISEFMMQNAERTWAIFSVFCDQYNAECEGAAKLFLNEN
jgi:hypothetical protein